MKRILTGQDAPVDRLEARLDELPQFVELFADRPSGYLKAMPG